MEYQGSVQVDIQEIREKQFDLIIAASGFETRSITLFQNYYIAAPKKVAFAFTEKTADIKRKNNDAFFISQGFTMIDCSGENTESIQEFLIDYFSKIEKDSIEILIDYSSMTRKWYADIINLILTKTFHFQNISVFFSYTPAGFNLPKKNTTVKFADSLLVHEPAKNSNKPLALIIGLGIDSAKASYLIKKLNPSELIIMYADPAYEKKYVETVLNNNRKLIELVEIRKILNYPLANIGVTNEILTPLCLALRMKYNIIIAPLGPKVFSLNSLLLSAMYPDIDVWRVSSGDREPVYDRVPSKDPIILNARFIEEDIEF